jgi:N-acetylglutamate synthase-like GNAT family acetyltransferase
MGLTWHRESSPRWDADKARIVGGAPEGVFAVASSTAGAVLPGDWWRADLDGRVVGYGWMDHSWGDAEVLLAVDPVGQSSGVGTFILDRLDDEAAARGINYLYNVVPDAHPDPASLRRWLQRRGFAASQEGGLLRRRVQPRA